MIERVNEIGKKRIVLSGLWTGVRIVGPALSVIDQGFEVFEEGVRSPLAL
ncbi:hypothetical protein VPARA_14040 [Variovorax paradoxus]|uniref:Uncharacterized protein n=1 Tax=Variovorax paradoxus TaxID=34073 RepID=A0A0H2M4G0_VARPD|nr:hypothetical protein VPARA_14040 [Variovorax paradoxus]